MIYLVRRSVDQPSKDTKIIFHKSLSIIITIFLVYLFFRLSIEHTFGQQKMGWHARGRLEHAGTDRLKGQVPWCCSSGS